MMEADKQFKPLPMPVGQMTQREKRIWKDLTSTLAPGHISHAEIPLVVRLVKILARIEFLEAEWQEIVEQSGTSLTLNGNGAVACQPILVAIDRAYTTCANLYSKLRICASSREQITSAASRGATVRNPGVLRDEVDTLFAGEPPATKAERARWAREKRN